ncbi:isochorismatase family protein [Nocardioides sp. NBC_00163]|uniref:isochorismatase family protein n=1 Tax=Nocardioides sp. NBC_00163 TaxID=2975999 RepID=UPI0032488B5B
MSDRTTPEGAVMKRWTQNVPEHEAGALGAGRLGLGQRSALIVVDVTYGFTGSAGLTLDEARQEYSTAAGPSAWEAMPHIARLIELVRSKSMPVVYTRSSANDQAFVGRATKKPRTGARLADGFGDFPGTIAPETGDWVLEKTKASAFFQTPLSVFLVREKVESVIVCGVSTSGCVRATAVDSCSNGFSTFVVDDACFDRSWFAHCNNLFDMATKYADVLSVDELEKKWS